MASEEVPTTATSVDANTVNAAAEQHVRPDSLLVPQMDAAIEAAERRRWGRLLQGGIFHRRLLHQRWDAEALLRGSLHRPHPVAARTAVRATTTSALLVTLNINPALWLGENENENEDEDEDGASTRASRLYTWSSPALLPGDNGSILDELSQRLESQYRSLSKRSLMVSYFHNARIEEFVRTLLQCRHQAGPSSKVIIHYGGHGVPQPRSGSFYLYPQVGEAVKYPLDALCSHVGFPLVMIADCPNAGSILHRLLENRQKADMNQHFTYGPYKKGMNTSKLEESERPTDMMMAIPTWERYENTSFTGMENKNMTPLVSPLPGNNSRGTLSNIHGLNSCRGVSPSSPRPPPLPAHASPSASPLPYDDFFFIGSTQDGPLPHHPRLPSDILTSCLTTPLRMLLLWFIIEHTHTSDIHPLLIYLIPGDINDKKTPLGELQWAFMSITECIAWSALPYTLFVHLFREDVVIAPLFRGFLLADRIITALGGELSVYPPFPKTCHHVLWDTLDNIIDRTFVSLWRAVRPTPPPVLHSVEFREWLDWNVIRWKYEMETMPLPSLGDRCVVVPNFLQEELSCLSTEVERITEQSFSRLTTMMDQYPREEEQCQRQGEREGVEEEEEEKEKRGGGSGEKRGKLGYVGNSSTTTLRRSRKEEEGGDNPLFFLRAHHNASSGLKPFPHILRLPMLLQGLLVLSHRDQATYLVCRLIDAGPLAVSACAEVGIFNMALVHYWSRRDLRHLLPTLLFIYAKACYTDPSLGGGTDTTQRRVIIDACREIMENPIVMMPAAAAGSSVEPGAWQRDVLGSWAESQGQRLLAVSLLTTICMYSLEARNQCRECGVLRLCCELLQSVAATAPRVPWILLSSTPEKAVREKKREENEGNESEKEGVRDGHGENNNNVIESKDPAVMTTYILGLIALFVTLSWEGELSVNNTSEKEDGESEREELYSAWGLRQYISSSLDALQLLLTSTYSTVRGASFKAITAVLVSRITDEETALKCVRLITMRIGVQEPPGEGNTDNRLELVGGLSMSIKWLIERLSPRLSLEKIRNAVCYELKKAGRVVFGTLPHGCDEKTRRSHDTDIFPGRGLSPHEGSPLSPSTIVHETDDLLDMLVRLTCQLEVVTNDSCPFVVAHSQKVLREVLTMLDVQQLSFLRHTSDAPFGHVDTSTISRNSGITHFFSGVINTLTSRTGGGGVQQRPRESGRQRNQVSNSTEGDEGDDGDDDYDGDSMEEILDPSSSNTVSEQDGASDILASPRTLSIHGNSTIFSFIFTLLSFLDELLLVPVDDCDPRHPFNLEKEACLLKYLRQLRDELRVSAVPHDSYNYSRENEGRPVVLPLLSCPSALWNYPVSLPMTLSREDEARGHKPKLSPLLDNTTSPFPGNVDSPTSWSKDCQNHFQLLAEKNIFSERDGHIQVMTFHPTERHFVTGTSQGVIQVWSLADRDALLLPPPPPAAVAVAVAVAGGEGGGSSSLASSSPSAGPVARRAGDPCRLLARIQLSEVVRRQGFTIPPSTVLRYMYSTYPVRAMSSQCFRHGPSMSGDGVMTGGEMFDVSSVRQGNYARGGKGADPLTGLHLIDSAYRTLLCAVGRSGSVQIFSGYTNKRRIKRITSFGTMTYEEALRSHQCLSSYHVPAVLLHVSGADGSITTWDLNCEQKISEETGRREYTHSPTSLASHPYDVFSFAVGAGSVYLYDLRDSSRCTHVLPDPTSLGQPVQRQERSLGNYNKPLCLHIGFPCRYPHGLVTGYGGEQGVVMLWDDRKLQRPILQTVVSDMRGTSASSLNSVGFMDVQHYHHALMTLSVTADALFISDALSLSSSSSSFEGNANRTHIPLRQQTSATSFHPVLPLCGVAGGGVLQLYARGKPLMPNQKA